jgi:hypothetical protein
MIICDCKICNDIGYPEHCPLPAGFKHCKFAAFDGSKMLRAPDLRKAVNDSLKKYVERT